MGDAPTLNGLRILSVRLTTPGRGVWWADCALDPDTVSQAPTSGAASLVCGSTTLTGTVDPRGSSSFVAGATARVVAGAGAWESSVGPQAWEADNGVTSIQVYNATAAAVGERVTDLAPVVLGTDFVRMAGPASRVFRDRTWWVDPTGQTFVGDRPSAQLDSSATIVSWDAAQMVATLTCDALVLPGTTLSDPRFNGASYVVRDVEQTFDVRGSHVTAWCAGAPVSRLGAALKRLVRELGRTSELRAYRYRYAENVAGRMGLTSADPQAPDLSPVGMWSGMTGLAAKLSPGAEIAVLVLNDGTPIPIAYAPGTPLELDLAGGSDFVALAQLVHAELEKIASCFAGFVSGSGGANFPAAILYGGPTVPVGSVAASRTKAT